MLLGWNPWIPWPAKDSCASGAAGEHTFRIKSGFSWPLRIYPIEAISPDDGTVSLWWSIWSDDAVLIEEQIHAAANPLSGGSGNVQAQSYTVEAVGVELILEELESGDNPAEIDPTAEIEDRERYLRVETTPAWPNLEIVDIVKERLEEPNCGHVHEVDQTAWKCRGGTDLDHGVTNAEGIFQFRYRGPELSGDFKVTVQYRFPNHTEIYELEQIFNSRYEGLGEFTGGEGIALTGETETHPDNHWATETTRTHIGTLGQLYSEKFDEDLMVNDMSLEFGGLFDIDGDCEPPHNSHRIGQNADVYPSGVPTNEKWKFIKREIAELGSTYFDEIDGNHPHIHFIE